MEALIGFWGKRTIGTFLLCRRNVCVKTGGRNRVCAHGLRLVWYPSFLLLYAGGIAAVASNRYDNLYELMQLSIHDPVSFERNRIIVAIGAASGDLDDVFKALPNYAQKRHPRSEYMYAFFEPVCEGLFSL